MLKPRYFFGIIFLCLLILSPHGEKLQGSVDLVTVPTRESVQLTIYNSADITMVSEVRRLTFKKGLNKIQFAWAGTLIDPTSLRLSFKTHNKSLELVDTVYPPRRKDALQWNIQSSLAGSALVELSYFTSGLTWKADYVLISDKKENKMNLQGFVRVFNNSGEDYPNAKVRLVVGNINLVEKIKTLARGFQYKKLSRKDRRSVRDHFNRGVRKAEVARSAPSTTIKRPKAIVKEGLSEYFLFTVEGREDIRNGWQKRMRSLRAREIPLQVIYRLSDRKTRAKVFKYYEFKNQSPAPGPGKLGDSPLPDGRFQIFARSKNKDLSYLGRVHTKYVARGDKVKLKLGRSKDVRVTRVLKDYRRFDVKVSKYHGGRRYIRNYKELFSYETLIENTLPYPVKVEVERSFGGRYTLKDLKFKKEKVDLRTFKYFPEMSAGKSKKFNYGVQVFRGRL